MKGNRRFQYLAAFGVSLGTMTNGMALFWTAPILPKFHNNEIIDNITSTEISWIITSLVPGMILGSLLASRVSDHFGRRIDLLCSAFPYIIGTVLMLCATKAWVIYIGRIFWGTGTGMINTVSGIYLSEISDKEIRGTLTAATRFMFNLGVFLTLTVGSFLSYQVLSSLIIVFAAGYFIVCLGIQESPYYLLKEGKVDKAEKALLRFSGLKDKKMIEERLSLMRSDVRKEMTRSSTVKELLTGKQYRRAVIIVTGLRITQLMTGMIPVQQYLGRIVQLSNSGINLSTVFVVFGALRFVVSLISPLIVDKVGRRPLLISSFSAVSVILTIIGTYFFIQQVIGIDNEATSPFRYTVFLGIILANIISSFGFDTLVFIIPSEIFPINVRAIAMTVANIFTAFVTFIAIRSYQIMEDNFGLYWVFWIYATVALSGAVFTHFVIIETRGKTLGEIQKELQGSMYDDTVEKLNTVVNDDIESNTELKDLTSKVASR